MSTNLIAINVGNSRMHSGVFAEGQLASSVHFERDDLGGLVQTVRSQFEQIQNLSDPAIYLATVVDGVADAVEARLKNELGVSPVRMERDEAVPIGRQLDPEALPGVDRLLNVAAAYDMVKEACVVVDAGTAVTVDFVDGAGTFHGGAILPGTQLMLRSLAEGTDQLPEIELAEPKDAIGHNTFEAIRSGVFHGLRGAVRELVERYAEFYQAYPRVVATGGDAALLFERYELIEKVIPELTLHGMAVTRRYATESDE